MLQGLCKVHHFLQLILIGTNLVIPGCSDCNLMKEIKDEIKKLPHVIKEEISSMKHGEFYLLQCNKPVIY